jgi:hypothetical protein
MKALTIQQPWASLIAMRVKTIEFRSWKTNYRGLLAIHAGQRFPAENKELLHEKPYSSYIDSDDLPLPLGQIIAVAELVDVFEIGYANQARLKKQYNYPLGNLPVGMFGWALSNVNLLENPIPWKGCLGLWNPPPIPGFE